MPPPQTVAEFKNLLVAGEPENLARQFVTSEEICALPAPQAYSAFRQRVINFHPECECVAIVGSGNWKFSLNPEKLLSEYHPKSDIDVAVVSESKFLETWERLRAVHRRRWYTLDNYQRKRLLRNGENIYAGFACPVWISTPGDAFVYSFRAMLEKLSDADIGYRQVKMMYFRNMVEMIDYYRRGFAIAKLEILK